MDGALLGPELALPITSGATIGTYPSSSALRIEAWGSFETISDVERGQQHGGLAAVNEALARGTFGSNAQSIRTAIRYIQREQLKIRGKARPRWPAPPRVARCPRISLARPNAAPPTRAPTVGSPSWLKSSPRWRDHDGDARRSSF